jgi:hypothetical protein
VNKHDDAQAHCTPTCAAGGGAAIQADAKQLALGATIGFAAGGALVVGGIVLVATAPSARASKSASGSALRVVPLVSRDGLGVVLAGGF